MQTYIGTKIIEARPMNRGDYNLYRGWDIPEDENPDDTGYLVRYPDGYESWSPSKQFEAAYKVMDSDMDFGTALLGLKQGKKIARQGWNGKGMFLFLLPAGTIPKSAIHDPMLKSILSDNGKDHFEALGSIRMKTADDKILTGWLASQTDMLAEDWVFVD